MKVAFLGLGRMGAPMAANLVRGGHELTVWNRTRQKSLAFAAEHPARVAASPAEAAAGAGVVITMLADPAALAAVLEGPTGGLIAMQHGALLLEMSTVDPATTLRLADAARSLGLRYMDAPVIGSLRPAREATLLILAAGTAEDVTAARPILEALGRLMHVGPTGSGAALKLVINCLGAHMMAGFTSALVLARAVGVDPATAVAAIQGGGFSSPVYQHRGPKILAGDFEPDFTLHLALKDWRLAMAMAEAAGCPLPTLAPIIALAEQAIAAGLGDEDLGALIKPLEASAGISRPSAM